MPGEGIVFPERKGEDPRRIDLASSVANFSLEILPIRSLTPYPGTDLTISNTTREVSTMIAKRNVEIFSAGCLLCEETIRLVNRLACPSCKVTVLDMKEPAVFHRAKALGIRSIPSVAVNGNLVPCSSDRGPDEASLRAAGIGFPTP